jgi:hypothetical protein
MKLLIKQYTAILLLLSLSIVKKNIDNASTRNLPLHVIKKHTISLKRILATGLEAQSISRKR